MSAQQPPSNYYSGATYNSSNFSNSANGNYAILDKSNTFTQNQFCSVDISENSSETLLITKGYVDNITFNQFATVSGDNTWTGTNTFDNLPTSTQLPTTSTQLTTKAYSDSTYATLAGNNNFIGTNNMFTSSYTK